MSEMVRENKEWFVIHRNKKTGRITQMGPFSYWEARLRKNVEPKQKRKIIATAHGYRISNPRPVDIKHLWERTLDDPFIYQRILKPVSTRLVTELNRGSFSRRKWVRSFLTAAEHVAKAVSKDTGKKVSRAQKVRLAVHLARELWKNTMGGK